MAANKPTWKEVIVGILGLIVAFCAAVVVGWLLWEGFSWMVETGDRNEIRYEERLKFTGACENLGGTVAETDGGWICIKGGKIILTGKEPK